MYIYIYINILLDIYYLLIYLQYINIINILVYKYNIYYINIYSAIYYR